MSADLLRKKIQQGMERQAQSSLQHSLISEIEHKTTKVFLELVDQEVTVRINNRNINSPVILMERLQTSLYNIVEIQGHRGIVGIGARFIDTAIARLTGASSKQGEVVERTITPTDVALAGVIFLDILAQVFGDPIETAGYEKEKAPLIFLLQDTRYAFLNIEIFDLQDELMGNIELILPLPCIESFMTPSADAPDRYHLWQNHMTQVAQEAPLDLASIIQRIPVSLETILDLKIGDTLELSEGSLQHLEMEAATSKEPQVIFKGQLGSLNTHKAFRVTGLITPEAH